ncbi:hypothetical protein PROFUN_08102 [Planoprotostelium fungivorum]|uniref:DH domain-containing protein n=1 Tax=Planoprotostelium fungivorum TaxID=1890364 RepID=A0A2P6NKI4_9EUKA|nr:hypothetical protein PROFUN_08102 [Planoprotostelium fungivorum]
MSAHPITNHFLQMSSNILKEKLELERIIFGIPLPGALDLSSVLTSAQKFQSSFFIEPKSELPTSLQLVALRRENGNLFLYSKLGEVAVRWSPSLSLYIPTKMSYCEGRPMGSVEIQFGDRFNYTTVTQKLCEHLVYLNLQPPNYSTDSDAESLRTFLTDVMDFDLTEPKNSRINIFISENSNSENNFLRTNPSWKAKSVKWQHEVVESSLNNYFAPKVMQNIIDSILHSDSATMERLLLENMPTPPASRSELPTNVSNSQGWTPLQLAAMSNDEPLCERLLDFGADPRMGSFEGLTPLHCFTKANSSVFLTLQSLAKSKDPTPTSPAPKKTLLSSPSGPISQFFDFKLMSAPDLASAADEHSSLSTYLRTVRLLSALLAHGSFIDVRNSQGETPRKAYYISKWLILNGANINATTKVNFTPLHFAMFTTEELISEYSGIISRLGNTKKSSNKRVIKFNKNTAPAIPAEEVEFEHGDSYFLMLDLLAFMLERGANTKLRALPDNSSSSSFTENDLRRSRGTSSSSSDYVDNSVDESFQEWVNRQPKHVQEVLDNAIGSNKTAASQQRRSIMIKHSILKGLEKEFKAMTLGAELSKKTALTIEPTTASLADRKKVDPALREPKQVLTEIVDKEASYVQHLNTLKDLYMDVVADMIGRETHNLVFKHFQSVFNLHQQLVLVLPTSSLLGSIDISDARTSWTEAVISDEEFRTLLPIVVSTFSSFLPHFKIYGDYVNNMHLAMQAVHKCMSSNEKFANYCRETAMNTPSHLDIQDLLIMPFQKITRYSMLFERLAKLTPPTITSALQLPKSTTATQRARQDSNTNPLMNFCQEFIGLVGSINQSKIEAEARQKVIEIASMLPELQVSTTATQLLPDFVENLANFPVSPIPTGQVPESNFVQAHRTFIREGKIVRHTEEGSTEFFAYLFNDLLVMIDQTPRKKAAFIFDLSNLFVFDNPDLEETVYDQKSLQPVLSITNCFQMVAMRLPVLEEKKVNSRGHYARCMKNWTISTGGDKEKKDWLKAIRKAKRELDVKVKTFSPIKT